MGMYQPPRRSFQFDGFTRAIDDDFEIDGDMGLLQGARAVFAVHRDWADDGQPLGVCELIALLDVNKPHGTIMQRARILEAFGLPAVHRAEESASAELTTQFRMGVAA